jgi:type 1 fimbriae regulatory protein FimB
MTSTPVWLVPNARIVPNPHTRTPVTPHLTTQTGKNYLTPAEMTRLLQAAKHGTYGVRDEAMLRVGYDHGLRVSELVGLRWDQVHLKEGKLYVKRLKGSDDTLQPMAGQTIRALRAWELQRQTWAWHDLPYVFISERGPMSRKAVNYLIAEAAKRAGLPHVHPHMLRHSRGYALVNQGYDTRLIQAYLGHKNISHTVRYTRINAKRFEGILD